MLARVKVQTDDQQKYHGDDGSSTEKPCLRCELRRCKTGRVSVCDTVGLHIEGGAHSEADEVARCQLRWISAFRDRMVGELVVRHGGGVPHRAITGSDRL